MSDKYFFGKCGGEDCMFRTGVILGEHQCLKDIEKCSKERCQNCPHGKTMEEMAEYIEWNGIAYRLEAQRIIKALLGEEDK